MTPNRRRFLQASAAGWLASTSAAMSGPVANPNLSIAPFRFDVTPPKGHSLCGGWIKPVESVDDPLEAIGFVLMGSGKPIVICVVDWTGLLNSAHAAWVDALAEAAGTTPDRVAVQCVHQHNAPFACLDAEDLIRTQRDLPHIIEKDFFRTCLDRCRAAVKTALPQARRVTHLATGAAKVDRVASNRRVYRDATGKVLAMRGSSCKDPKLIALPEGTIDPNLRTVAFYDRDTKLVACHYYATHPMSYYGDGRVSSDFVGLARKQRQTDDPGCTHLYFTGCAGNISAGKYNDGSKEQRPILTRRILDGILTAEKTLKPEPIGRVEWRTAPFLPPPRREVSAEVLAQQVADKSSSVVGRNRPAFELAWHRRTAKKSPPILLSALHINDTTLMHLPSEVFLEYQLRAQALAPRRFVAVAAYGDGGPWYIPTREEYPHGGYEVSVAFCDPVVDEQLTQGLRNLLR